MCRKTIRQWLMPGCLLSGLLSSLPAGLGLLRSGLLRGGPLRSLYLLCCLLCCQQRGLACCMLGGVLGNQLGLARLFFHPRRIGNMLSSGCAFCRGLLAGLLICSSLLFFYGLLDAEACLFPCLRTRRRKVFVFCAV